MREKKSSREKRKTKCKAMWPLEPRPTLWWVPPLSHEKVFPDKLQGNPCLEEGKNNLTVALLTFYEERTLIHLSDVFWPLQ